jgi:hypothetical protein
MHLVEIFGWEYAENGNSDRLEDSTVERCTPRLADKNISERGILIWGTHPYIFQSDTWPAPDF